MGAKRTRGKRGRGPLVEVEWVARTAGVTKTAFAKWRKANGYASIKGEGHKHFVSWEAAQKYLDGNGAARMDSPPPGWKTAKEVAAATGLPERLLRRGTTTRAVPLVKVRSRLYVEPRALVEWAKAQMPADPPPGWVPARDLAAELGVKPGAVRAFVRRHGLEHIHARVPGMVQTQMVLAPASARRVRFTVGAPRLGPGEAGVMEFGARYRWLRHRFYHYVVDVARVRTFKRRRKDGRVVRAARLEDLEKAKEGFRAWFKNHSRRGRKGVRPAGGCRGEGDGEGHPRDPGAGVAHHDRQVLAEAALRTRENHGGHWARVRSADRSR